MKYITITSKHHDGFAMFDSKVSDYDVVDRTPYGKDGSRGGFSLRESKRYLEVVMPHVDLPVAFDNSISRGAISFEYRPTDRS